MTGINGRIRTAVRIHENPGNLVEIELPILQPPIHAKKQGKGSSTDRRPRAYHCSIPSIVHVEVKPNLAVRMPKQRKEVATWDPNI